MTNRDAFIARWGGDVYSDEFARSVDQLIEQSLVEYLKHRAVPSPIEITPETAKLLDANTIKQRDALQAKLDRVTELVGGLRAAALAAESLSHTAYAQDYQRGLSHAYASSADDLEQVLKEVEK